MDICNIRWRLFTSTNGINGISLSVSHLYLPGFFFFSLSYSIIFPARSNNIYHIFCDILFEIHRHQPLNKCFVFFVFLITFSLSSWCCLLSSLYLFSSFVFFVAFTFSIESYRLVRDASYLSVREVSIVSGLFSFASFLNDLNSGGNRGGHC